MMNKIFILLDFDRTLADTDQLKADFDRLLEQGLSQAQAIKAFGRAGQTLESRQKYLLPGANKLLTFLQQQAIAHGILTYGQADWQQAKILAAGLADLPVLVTDQTDKGTLIASWRQASGAYQLPPELGGQIAERIMLVDDHDYSFEGLPTEALGLYCGIDPEVRLPANVYRISHLSEIEDYCK